MKTDDNGLMQHALFYVALLIADVVLLSSAPIADCKHLVYIASESVRSKNTMAARGKNLLSCNINATRTMGQAVQPTTEYVRDSQRA